MKDISDSRVQKFENNKIMLFMGLNFLCGRCKNLCSHCAVVVSGSDPENRWYGHGRRGGFRICCTVFFPASSPWTKPDTHLIENYVVPLLIDFVKVRFSNCCPRKFGVFPLKISDLKMAGCLPPSGSTKDTGINTLDLANIYSSQSNAAGDPKFERSRFLQGSELYY